MRVFIYTDLNDDLKQQLRNSCPNDVLHFNTKDERESWPFFRECEVLMGNPPVRWFEHPVAELRFWQLDSAGFDQYKQVKTEAQVANMGEFFSPQCAETMVAGILAFYRGIPRLIDLKKNKKWVGKPLRYDLDLLGGKKVMILGAGSIALSVRKILSGFSCTVKLTARTNPAADLHDPDSILQSLNDTNVVINTLPGGAGRFVNEKFFSSMKSGSLYASVGRGSTTDESALIHALQSGKLAGAVLDVTASEPLPVTSPLWEMGHVILTQHTGGGYKYEDEGKIELFLENLKRFKDGVPVNNVVDLSQGY